MAQDWAGFSEEELRRLKQNKGSVDVQSLAPVKDWRPRGWVRGRGAWSSKWAGRAGGAPQG